MYQQARAVGKTASNSLMWLSAQTVPCVGTRIQLEIWFLYVYHVYLTHFFANPSTDSVILEVCFTIPWGFFCETVYLYLCILILLVLIFLKHESNFFLFLKSVYKLCILKS